MNLSSYRNPHSPTPLSLNAFYIDGKQLMSNYKFFSNSFPCFSVPKFYHVVVMWSTQIREYPKLNNGGTHRRVTTLSLVSVENELSTHCITT